MRFLVTSRNKYPVPPELLPALLDGAIAWIDKHRSSGKVQDEWAFAGVQGGGGILNAESLEEVDAILQEFPLSAFSENEVIPLVDAKSTFQRAKQIAQAMMAQTRR